MHTHIQTHTISYIQCQSVCDRQKGGYDKRGNIA